MKIIKSLLILLFFSTLSFAQSEFEGTITMKMSGIQETETKVEVDEEVVSEDKKQSDLSQTIVFHLKGDKSVMEMENGGMPLKVIMDNATGDIYNIISVNGEKMIQKMNVKDPAFQAMLNSDEAESFDGTVKKTGKKKMIGDYLCYEYIVTEDDGTGTIWATPSLNIDLAERVPLMKAFMKQSGGYFLKPSDDVKGFVLELKGTDGEGKDMNIDITVEKKSLSDDIFSISEDKKEQANKEEKVRKLAEEYRKKMLEAKDDPQKVKELSEEFQKKMKEIQGEN